MSKAGSTRRALKSALRDGKVRSPEAKKIVDIAKRGGVNKAERAAIRNALNSRPDDFTDAARARLERAIGRRPGSGGDGFITPAPGSNHNPISTPNGPASARPVPPLKPEEQAGIDHVNAHRASLGMQPLRVDGNLTALAQEWAQKLAADGALSHRPQLGTDVNEAGGGNWLELGENVGMATNGEPAIFQAWLDSPPHRANMENPNFNAVGIGSFTDATGKTWMVQVFAQY